ncbi:MAG: hypothetical protein P8X91_03310 [Candidatus Bathyarchaeota archaeon]|jgi:hypothetical protein
MKNLKIIILATTIAIVAVVTVGVVLAFSFIDSSNYAEQIRYSAPISDDEWWDEMIEHMEDHWNEVDQTTDGDWWDEMIERMDEHLDDVPQEIQDEEWFNDMRAYIEEHIGEVQTQHWFDEMTEFMEDQRYEYGYRYNYYPRSSGRGCMGW